MGVEDKRRKVRETIKARQKQGGQCLGWGREGGGGEVRSISTVPTETRQPSLVMNPPPSGYSAIHPVIYV